MDTVGECWLPVKTSGEAHTRGRWYGTLDGHGRGVLASRENIRKGAYAMERAAGLVSAAYN